MLNLLTCGTLCAQLAAKLSFFTQDGNIVLACEGTEIGRVPTGQPTITPVKCYETCSFTPSVNKDKQTVNVWNAGNEAASLVGTANFINTDANGNPWRNTPAPTTTVSGGATGYVYQFNTTAAQLATVEGYVTIPPASCFCPNEPSIRFRQASAGVGRYMWYASPDANPDNAAIVGAQHVNSTNSGVLTVPLDPNAPTVFWQRHYLANNALDAAVRLQYTIDGTTWLNVPDDWYATDPNVSSAKIRWQGPVGGPYTDSSGNSVTQSELDAQCAVEIPCF